MELKALKDLYSMFHLFHTHKNMFPLKFDTF